MRGRNPAIRAAQKQTRLVQLPGYLPGTLTAAGYALGPSIGRRYHPRVAVLGRHIRTGTWWA